MDVISVNHISKRFRRHDGSWGRVKSLLFPEPDQPGARWALKDVSFTVARGESVGIIGQNGAGKSTLLKIITGATTPTEGHVAVNGRVAALLELGMGFHPDFTGRENAYMAGQLLGFTTTEVAQQMGAIEAFAEIGSYMDEPVRTYSSGMQVRLAFAVATAVRPDVLIVDEALAVGDIFFQQKCFQRIKAFHDLGTTLLFVSHDLGAVQHLCDRAIYLEQGCLLVNGTPAEAVGRYEASLIRSLDQNPGALRAADAGAGETDVGLAEGEPGSITTEWVSVDTITVSSQGDDRPQDSVLCDAPMQLAVTVQFHKAFADPHIGFKIRDRLGKVMFETNSYCMRQSLAPVAAGERIRAVFSMEMRLIPQDYTLTIGVADGGYGDANFRQVLAYLHGRARFTVRPNRDAIIWAGMANLHPALSFSKVA